LIHPTSIVDRRAELDSDVEIGPFCVVGAGVSLARGVKLLSHAVVEGPTHLGARTVVHPFAVVGGAPQDRTYKGEPTRLEVGEDTIIRESVTIHRGTVKDRGLTRIGARVLLMGAVHVAHDVVIEDDCTVANGCLLAGHAHLEEAVNLGGNVALAPFVRIGAIAFVAAGARVEQDVPPFHVAQGDRARVRALNVIGLERRGVDETSQKALAAAHRTIYRTESAIAVAAASLESEDPWVKRLLEFVRTRTTVPGPPRRGYPSAP
jgi:UDP-N-acetylglucosamine acyltransferase